MSVGGQETLLRGLIKTLKLYREAIRLDNEQLEQQQGHRYVHTLALTDSEGEVEMLNKHIYDIPGFMTKEFWNMVVEDSLNSSDGSCIHRSIIQYDNTKKMTTPILGEYKACDVCKHVYEGGRIQMPAKPDRISTEDAYGLYYAIKWLFYTKTRGVDRLEKLLRLDDKAKQYTLERLSSHYNVEEWAEWMQQTNTSVSICLRCFWNNKSLVFISNDRHNANGCHFCSLASEEFSQHNRPIHCELKIKPHKG